MTHVYRRRVARGLAYVLAATLVPLLAGVVGLGTRLASAARTSTNPPPYSGALPPPPPHDPSKRTAVVIAANSGTESSDFLAPYAVLATSGAFNLYAVAPERRIIHLFPGGPLLRGVDFVPHYAFSAYDAAIGGDPDLIVIPFLVYDQAPEYQAILAWIRAHAGPHTVVLSICAGAKNLADTGLLDGRSATTHHYTFPLIAQTRPEVNLVRGVRYLEDGNFISSAGVTAGVDATLFTLKRMLGRDVALAVAQQIGYPYARFLDDPAYAPSDTGLLSTVATAPPLTNMLLSSFQVGNSQLGVALYDGVSELALASVVDTYPREGALTINTVAPERTTVLSQHGLALVPRWSFADAPALDRIILPGRDADTDAVAAFERWAQAREQLPVERVHRADGYVYDVTFNDIARRAGTVVANEAVYVLEYPLGRVTAAAPLFAPGLLVRLAALALLGLGLAAVVDRWLVARPQRRQARVLRPAAAA